MVMPSSSASRFASVPASSKPPSTRRTSPPYWRTAATFASGAPAGITSTARAPASRAAHDTACAWFPALAATTPHSRASSESWAIVLVAPRALKDPVS